MKNSYIVKSMNAWSKCEPPIVVVSGERTVVTTSRRVKILRALGLFDLTLVDEQTVYFSHAVAKDIILSKIYPNIKVVDLETREVFECCLAKSERKFPGVSEFRKVATYVQPSIGAHLCLALIVSAVVWGPTIIHKKSALGVNKANSSTDLVQSNSLVLKPSHAELPKELWFHGKGFFELSASGKTLSTAAISKRFSGFGIFSSSKNSGDGTGGVPSSGASVSDMVAQYKHVESKSDSSGASLTVEQQKRVHSKMKTAEVKMASVFDQIKKQNREFSVSVSYQLKVVNSGKTVPVKVVVEGAGSAELKQNFRAEFERIVASIDFGNDLSGVVFQGQKVFVN
jgi:hypothetical protein